MHCRPFALQANALLTELSQHLIFLISKQRIHVVKTVFRSAIHSDYLINKWLNEIVRAYRGTDNQRPVHHVYRSPPDH